MTPGMWPHQHMKENLNIHAHTRKEKGLEVV